MKLRYTKEVDFPDQHEIPSARLQMTAAYLLEYHAKMGKIPNYSGLVEELRKSAKEIFTNSKLTKDNPND
jgi:hypothetical protein